MRKIEKISFDHSYDFINIENRAYSYGNNIGIKHANEKYNYKYLVISNPDIIIIYALHGSFILI